MAATGLPATFCSITAAGLFAAALLISSAASVRLPSLTTTAAVACLSLLFLCNHRYLPFIYHLAIRGACNSFASEPSLHASAYALVVLYVVFAKRKPNRQFHAVRLQMFHFDHERFISACHHRKVLDFAVTRMSQPRVCNISVRCGTLRI